MALGVAITPTAAGASDDARNGDRDGGGVVNNAAKTLKPQPSPPLSAAAAAPWGRLDPLTVEIKDGREGIGFESERKRQLREEFERHAQQQEKRKLEEERYQERMVRKAEERRVEGLCAGGDEGVGEVG